MVAASSVRSSSSGEPDEDLRRHSLVEGGHRNIVPSDDPSGPTARPRSTCRITFRRLRATEGPRQALPGCSVAGSMESGMASDEVVAGVREGSPSTEERPAPQAVAVEGRRHRDLLLGPPRTAGSTAHRRGVLLAFSRSSASWHCRSPPVDDDRHRDRPARGRAPRLRRLVLGDLLRPVDRLVAGAVAAGSGRSREEGRCSSTR